MTENGQNENGPRVERKTRLVQDEMARRRVTVDNVRLSAAFVYVEEVKHGLAEQAQRLK